MVLIESSEEGDSNGCQIIEIDKNHPLDEILGSESLRAVVAHTTSFLTETIDKFWSITSLERVFRG